MPGPPVGGYTEPNRTTHGRTDRQFGRLHHYTPVDVFVWGAANHRHRTVTAVFLLDDKVNDQIAGEFDAQIPQHRGRQPDRRDLPLGVASTPAVDRTVTLDGGERVILQFAGRDGVDVCVKQKRPAASAARKLDADIASTYVFDPVDRVGEILIAAQPLAQLYPADLTERRESFGDKVHRRRFLTRRRRSRDKIAQELLGVAKMPRHCLADQFGINVHTLATPHSDLTVVHTHPDIASHPTGSGGTRKDRSAKSDRYLAIRSTPTILWIGNAANIPGRFTT